MEVDKIDFARKQLPWNATKNAANLLVITGNSVSRNIKKQILILWHWAPDPRPWLALGASILRIIRTEGLLLN